MTDPAVTTQPLPVAPLPRAWWHGCWLRPGHYLVDRQGRDVGMDPCPLGRGSDVFWLDGGLAPRRASTHARLPFEVPADRIVYRCMGAKDQDLRWRIDRDSEECTQGEFLLHAIAGCTIAAWWDRTQGDSRGACNSCLIAEGAHSANEMLALFPQLFPAQAARLVAAGVVLRFLRWGTP